jgi:hypothetical protein
VFKQKGRRMNDLTLATEGEPDMPMRKTIEFHQWDAEQIKALIELVVKFGLHDWKRVAREHNHMFNLTRGGGRSPKAVGGMFGRIRDGFMYLQDPEVRKIVEDNPPLWTKVDRVRVGRPSTSSRMDKLEGMMEKVLEAMTKPADDPAPSNGRVKTKTYPKKVLEGLPPGGRHD